MLNEIDLRELADLRGPERAFVSLYLDDDAARDALAPRLARIRSLLADSPGEREHFDASLALLDETLADEKFQRAGLCLFACYALDFVRGYHLSVAPPRRVWLGAAPYLRPLAELQEEYEDFVFVVADASAAEIHLVASATPALHERIRGDVKNRVKKGGWSQKRYARRRTNELQHYAKEVAADVVKLVEEHHLRRIVLLGHDEALRAIEAEFPDAAAAKVVGRKSTDIDQPVDDLVDEAYELFFAQERSEERALWQRIRDEYFSDGLAAVGPEDTWNAAAVGQVNELIVHRDAKLNARRCRACENLSVGETDKCRYCGKSDVFPVDLVDAFVRQCEQTSAAVEFVDRIDGLAEVGDVAALLRY